MRAEDFMDYTVMDRNGERIGDVDAVWVDERTGEPEFVAVQHGEAEREECIIPLLNCDVNATERSLLVPFDKETIEDAPDLRIDRDISQEDEDRIYRHYGLAVPETGAWERTTERTTELEAERPLGRGEEIAEIPLREERTVVGKRMVEGPALRLRKVVRTERVNEPVELRSEHVELERVPPEELRETRGQGEIGRPFEEGELLLRERHEEPVLEKRTDVVGGVRAEREVETERREIEGEVRREDVEIEREREERRGLF